MSCSINTVRGLVVALSLVIIFAPAVGHAKGVSSVRLDQVVLDAQRGTAEIVSGEIKVAGASNYKQAADEFILSRPDLFGLNNPDQELQVAGQETDKLGLTHLRLNQFYQGVPVWGCQKIVHFKDASTIYLVGGQTIPTPSLSVIPGISASAAELKAQYAMTDALGTNQPRFRTQLIIFPKSRLNDELRLAYQVTVMAVSNHHIYWQVFVDAQSGTIIAKYNDLKDDGPAVGSGVDVNGNVRTLQTYQLGSDYKLIDASRMMYTPPISAMKGVIVTYSEYWGSGGIVRDPNRDNNFVDNDSLKAAVSAHYYAGLTYDYFLTTLGRNSWDNAGGWMRNNVHDGPYNNSGWYGDSALVSYGDGDGVNYREFSGGLDVVAHEFTHGVTQSTANLIYMNQSGALNESYSDFFSCMVDSANWVEGDGIYIPAPGWDRCLFDPHQGWKPTRFPFGYQPAKMSEFVDTVSDNGGVHINSGIPNKAGYLVGSTIGRPKAAQIWYRTLTTYLTPSSDFSYWSIMTLQAATDLYGKSSPEVVSVLNAFDSTEFSLLTVDPPRIVALNAALGLVSDTTVQLKNSRASSVSILSGSSAKGKVQVSGSFPSTLAQDESMILHVSFDASSGYSTCNLGILYDTVILTTSLVAMPTIRIPVSVSLGYMKTRYREKVLASSCLTATVGNRPVLTSFNRTGYNALPKATLLIGSVDGGDTTVYMDLYHDPYMDSTLAPNFTVVDTVSTSTAENGNLVAKLRFTTQDSRIQGTVRYETEPTGPAGCGYVLATYTLRNACGPDLVIHSGLLADFNVQDGYHDYCNFDADRKMVYVWQHQGGEACGLALLSKRPRNLRAVDQGLYLYGPFPGTVYEEMAATTNVASNTDYNWSALVTFGQDSLHIGDSVVYRVAMLFSTTGTTGLTNTLLHIDPSTCCVGTTGNVDGTGIVNLSDLSSLVSYLTGGGFVLPCLAEANVDGTGIINLSDLSSLVSYLTGGGFVLPTCP